MTILVAQISPQLLAKPPRLLQSGQGYDWKEFDRWLQKVYVILGAPQNSGVVNITNLENQESNPSVDIEADFTIDRSLEIQLLRQSIEQLTTELNMLQDHQQEITNTRKLIDDMRVEIDMIQNHQQEVLNIKKKIDDIYVELGAL